MSIATSPVAEPIYDQKNQLQMIQSTLLPGEQIEAVFDMKGGGTGFIGITSKRVIIYDKAFFKNAKAVVSIPYSRVHTVASKDDNGIFAIRKDSEVYLTTSERTYELEFRGADKAHIAHNLILSHIL